MKYTHGDGNGFSKIAVHQQDMGGWLRVFTDPPPPEHPDLPVWLAHALTEWFRQRPHIRPRCIIPVVQGGNTVELHAWYDLHVFPDLSGQKPTPIEHS
jgi:hypothetical protein